MPKDVLTATSGKVYLQSGSQEEINKSRIDPISDLDAGQPIATGKIIFPSEHWKVLIFNKMSF